MILIKILTCNVRTQIELILLKLTHCLRVLQWFCTPNHQLSQQCKSHDKQLIRPSALRRLDTFLDFTFPSSVYQLWQSAFPLSFTVKSCQLKFSSLHFAPLQTKGFCLDDGWSSAKDSQHWSFERFCPPLSPELCLPSFAFPELFSNNVYHALLPFIYRILIHNN